jgi:membrane protease YdiL (CAAX protease family)
VIFNKVIKGLSGNTSLLLIVSAVVSAAITIALFLWKKYTVVSPKYIRTGPWIVFIFAVLASIGAIIPSDFLQEQFPELPDIVKEELTMIIRSPYGFFVVGLLAPCCEELGFRGAVLHSLLEWSKTRIGWVGNHWSMILLSALLFAIIHFNPAQMPHAFLIGILLGWMYYRTGSILPGVALHWTNNSIAYIFGNILPDPDAHLITLLGSQQKVILALIYSLCILLPSIYMLNKQMKRA